MPVTTRSATGKLPSPRKPPVETIEPDAGDIDSEHDGNTWSATADGDMSSPSPEERPIKRPRRAEDQEKRSALSRRVRGRLSELPSMPLDILYEIFAHLPPADLISLARVNKSFRRVLMSRGSSFLWKESYELVPDVPPCPEDMTEPAWAHLLFGGSYCYTCGAKSVHKVIFALRRRACRSCMKAHFLCPSVENYPHSEFVPAVISNSGITPHTGRNWCREHWWDEDFNSFEAELSALKNRSHDADGLPIDVEAAVADFLEERRKQVAARNVHALLCISWENSRSAERRVELSAIKQKRFEDIKSRLLKLGHSSEDIWSIRRHREVHCSKPMSSRVWQRIEGALIAEVEKARNSRLERERARRSQKRAEVVLAEYSAWLKTLPPLLFCLAPAPYRAVSSLKPLSAIIALDDDENLNERIKEAFVLVSSEMQSRKIDREGFLRALLPEAEVHQGMEEEDILSLATSVYVCPRYKPPVAMSGLHMLVHDCSSLLGAGLPCPQVCEEGQKVVEALLNLLELGIGTTALELDKRNDRFACMSCPLSSHWTGSGHAKGRPARDWRSCIFHQLGEGHPTQQWLLIDRDQVPKDSLCHGGSTFSFGCLHCCPRAYTTGSWQSLENILKHLSNSHDKDDPLEGEDYFFNYKHARLGVYAHIAMPDEEAAAAIAAEDASSSK
ncbi:hypothetical protein BC834DRAFT_1040925 [Gloeopeniophorella convolvens]|nr:hypothetical protein BC834DRAFT_1040925 [Gloeopeniophorella convolvens]